MAHRDPEVSVDVDGHSVGLVIHPYAGHDAEGVRAGCSGVLTPGCVALEDFVGEKLILEEPRKKKIAREKKEMELKSGESAIEEKMRALAEKADEEAKDELKEEAEKEPIRVGEVVSEGV